jgi:hypothetical protein
MTYTRRYAETQVYQFYIFERPAEEVVNIYCAGWQLSANISCKCLTKKRPTKSMRKDSSQTKHNDKCGNSGGVHARQQCPAYGKQCRACGKLNHFQKVCRSSKKPFMRPRQRRPVNEVTEIQDGYFTCNTQQQEQYFTRNPQQVYLMRNRNLLLIQSPVL